MQTRILFQHLNTYFCPSHTYHRLNQVSVRRSDLWRKIIEKHEIAPTQNDSLKLFEEIRNL
jgi:hypothetical protein